MAENWRSPPLPEDVLEQNFGELVGPLTRAEALAGRGPSLPLLL